MNETELIRRLKLRDERAYRELILHYQQRVYQVCYRMMHQETEAEDMAQETFIRVFKSIHQFRADSSLNTWLYRIAINLCKNRIDYLRRRRQTQQTQLSDFEGDAWETQKKIGGSGHLNSRIDEPDKIAEGYEAQTLIERALQSLDKELRELLILRDIQGLTYHDIGKITHLLGIATICAGVGIMAAWSIAARVIYGNALHVV